MLHHWPVSSTRDGHQTESLPFGMLNVSFQSICKRRFVLPDIYSHQIDLFSETYLGFSNCPSAIFFSIIISSIVVCYSLFHIWLLSEILLICKFAGQKIRMLLSLSSSHSLPGILHFLFIFFVYFSFPLVFCLGLVENFARILISNSELGHVNVANKTDQWTDNKNQKWTEISQTIEQSNLNTK